MQVRISELRKRVTIDSPSEARDPHGQSIKTWTAVGGRWARVRPLGGTELFIAQQAGSKATIEVVMRHMPELTTQHRLRYAGKVLGIESVVNVDEANEFTLALCSVVT